jgi:proteasome alpha subunit
MLGDVFTHEVKPMEVEILVAEVGERDEDDRLYHILYDGTVVDERGFTVLGGEAETIADRLQGAYEEGLDAAGALRAAVGALAGPDRQLAADELEVALLTRNQGRRSFHRLTDDEVVELLGEASPSAEASDNGDTDTDADTDEG